MYATLNRYRDSVIVVPNEARSYNAHSYDAQSCDTVRILCSFSAYFALPFLGRRINL